MPDYNYPSSSEMVRTLSRIRVPYELIDTVGKFRIVRFQHPYWEGSEYWVVSDKDFMWEPADSLEDARAYLETDEAKEYSNG